MNAFSARLLVSCAAALALLPSTGHALPPCHPQLNSAGGPGTNTQCESEPPPFRLANIAGRARVQLQDRALIGGFIIGGGLPVRVLIRAIGTSLKSDDAPLEGRLLNPTLELRGGSGELIMENDDWRASPQADQVRALDAAPKDDKEAAIIATLEPGAYTAILRGAGETQGIGVIEIYDLRSSNEAMLSNLASRAFVSTGDNVLIGGFIIEGGPPRRVLLRAIGSSLAGTVPDELQDPTIEVVNGDGMTVGENDDWRKAGNAREIEVSGLAPNHEKESAVAVALGAGAYTATVTGKNGGTGNGVVEIYRLD